MQEEGQRWWSHPDRPCKGRTNEWFLEGVAPQDVVTESARLVALCMTCPVLGECHKDAQRSRRDFGQWVQGGLGIRGRNKSRRRSVP